MISQLIKKGIVKKYKSEGFITYDQLFMEIKDETFEVEDLEILFNEFEMQSIPFVCNAREFKHYYANSRRKSNKDRKKERNEYQRLPKDPLNRYMRIINNIKPIDGLELSKILTEIKNIKDSLLSINIKSVNDNQLKLKRMHLNKSLRSLQDRIVEGMMRLVVNLAQNYTNRGIDFLDLIQEGNQAVIKYVGNYNFRSDEDFTSKINNQICKSLERIISGNYSKSLPVLRNKVKKIKKLKSAEKILVQKYHGQNISTKEMIDKINIDKDLQKLVTNRSPKSLDQSMFEDDMVKLSDTIEDKGQDRQPHVQIQKEYFDMVHSGLNVLKAHELFVIEHRFGLKESDFKSWGEISKELNISMKNAKNLEKRALGKLKNFVKNIE